MQETVLHLSDHLRSSMTLHEQFLQRYRALGKGSAKSTRRAYTQNICKQSFLDSIDCMIAMFKKEITIWKKEKIQFSDEDPKVIMRVYETEISRLSEQRELIANEK